MQYIITIEEFDETKDVKYPEKREIFKQIVGDNVTEEVVCAVNNLAPQA